MKLLVVSDLHAHTKTKNDESHPSYLYYDQGRATGAADMLSLIVPALEADNLEVDLILSPGDLAHQANPDAQLAVWQGLQKLKQSVSAKQIIVS